MSATANAARLPGVGSKPSGLKTRRPALGAVGALVTLVILELASITGVLPASALPLASKVIVDVFGLLVDLAFLQDVGATLVAWFIGLSIASVFGIALGLVLGSFRLLFEAMGAVIEFLRPIPSVALLGSAAEMCVWLSACHGCQRPAQPFWMPLPSSHENAVPGCGPSGSSMTRRVVLVGVHW